MVLKGVLRLSAAERGRERDLLRFNEFQIPWQTKTEISASSEGGEASPRFQIGLEVVKGVIFQREKITY